MLITNHVLAATVIGHAVRRPGSAFAAGVVSHFAMDMLPHWGDHRIFDLVAPVDGSVGLAALGASVWRAGRARRLPVAAAILGACLPDMDKVGERFFGRSPYPTRVDLFHSRIQNESTRRLPVEVAAAVMLAYAGTRLAAAR